MRAARLELGNLTGVREQMREGGWESAIDDAVADLRYAVRRLRAAPGFSAVTLLTLALAARSNSASASSLRPSFARESARTAPLSFAAESRDSAAVADGDNDRHCGHSQ